MKIIIVGAGEVGFHLARRLSHEHDITLIDSDPKKIKRAGEQVDAFVLEGHGSSYRVLKQADVHHADVLAALTNNDEVNILACQMAKQAGVASTICRIRRYEYTQPDFLLSRERLGVDLLIHPEKETAEAIIRLIRRSIATDIVEFESGKIQLLGIRLENNAPILRIPLKDLGQNFADLPMRIVAINRKEQTLIPRGEDVLVPGDQVFVICDPTCMPEIIRQSGKTDSRIHDVMILGGGLIGQFVARELSKNLNVKVIESNEERSQEIADILPDSLIIHGDGTDIDLLEVEGLMDMDAFIAVTGSDETNIIATLVARHLKVPRTIALVNKVEYMPITPTIGMDAVVSKQLLTVNAVLRFVHSQQVASMATLPGVDAHVIEFIASPRSKIVRKALKDIHFPRHAIVGTVMHNGHVIIPRGDTRIEPGDRVVVFTLPRALGEVEKLFK